MSVSSAAAKPLHTPPSRDHGHAISHRLQSAHRALDTSKWCNFGGGSRFSCKSIGLRSALHSFILLAYRFHRRDQRPEGTQSRLEGFLCRGSMYSKMLPLSITPNQISAYLCVPRPLVSSVISCYSAATAGPGRCRPHGSPRAFWRRLFAFVAVGEGRRVAQSV